MKIQNDVTSSLRKNEPTHAKTTNAATTKTAASTSSAASVKISDASRALQSGASGSVDAPFDAKRVDAIKSAISAGTFKVNADAVAGKLIDSVSQLLAGGA